MKSESSCGPGGTGRAKEFFTECGKCRRVCYSDYLAEVTFDDETELAIVRIGEDEAVCGRCL
jgi:hypothetical protein